MGDDLRAKASAVADLAAEAVHISESDPHRALALAQEVESEHLDSSAQQNAGHLEALGLAKWAIGRASLHLGRHREAEVALKAAVELFVAAGDRTAETTGRGKPWTSP